MTGALPIAETTYSAGYLLLVLVVASAFAVGSGFLMQAAGYPFWAGALLGFFCGIFGLVVAIAFYFSRDRRRPAAYPAPPYHAYGYGQQVPPPGYLPQNYQQPPEYTGPQQPLSPVPPPPPGFAGQPAPPLDPRTLPPAPAEDSAAGTVVCPQCGAHVHGNTEFCGGCGVYLHPAHHQEVRSSYRVCPLCHTRADAGDDFCRKCGQSLSGTAAW
jgi:hypothetical protein